MVFNGREVIGTIGITNNLSLLIYEIDDGIDTYVVAGLSSSSGKPRKYKVYYGDRGSYFNYKGSRYYFIDIMSV